MFNYNHDESPYFLYDYSLYPSEMQQKNFADSYLKYLQEAKNSDYEQLPNVNLLLKEANYFALASHLYWTFWSIYMAKTSNIEFDYLVSYILNNLFIFKIKIY